MEHRAKQFMPFAALKGFEEALREREKIIVEKVELSEEKLEELDRTLMQINHNDMVRVVYFHKDAYLQIEGMVSRIDRDARILQVVQTKLSFSDIYSIELNI